MILLIDNYDSFSYNLYQLVGTILNGESEIRVIRNDECTVAEIEAMKPEGILLSPGPGKPTDAGVCIDVVRYFAGKLPILGVCLGHQAICEAFDVTVSYAKHLMHGKPSAVHLDGTCHLFAGMPETISAARYHSLAAVPETMHKPLVVTAKSDDGEIMAVAHEKYDVYGVQFHPESILTPQGASILRNFLNLRKREAKPADPVKTAIRSVIGGKDLDFETARTLMRGMMNGTVTSAQAASLLTALQLKGESVDEITACATVMREEAHCFTPEFDVMDIVGTGGDGVGTFNISTTTLFVVAAGGVPVAKHGNRAVSSKSGAADVLEKLGVRIDVSPQHSYAALKQLGVCFLFAQKYHTASRSVANVRSELGVRTLFNILGPLANPAGATLQLMGVFREGLVEPMARVLSHLGVRRGMVVYGEDGLDEATVTTRTKICEVHGETLKTSWITPEEMGLKRWALSDLVGGSAEENAAITRNLLSGRERGAKREIVLLNAGLCLYLAGKADTIPDGVTLAGTLIDSGEALRKLNALVSFLQDES
ncbi:MAG: bifunctional anthranilate synthase component II/anthranilate phosphoribosyltransferase [Planctomycetia bacterium]|nr:bifunctional anthranilate synthase component II/anthranilate phosphoribosyltransferase [Planctomycetia bacterium]